jgi:branched-subunit amino acid aminotransferase/4-amino-4-deoxychorismate lyase
LENISCYYDEQISPFSQTGMSLNDLLIQRGYGIFDYLRVVDNKPLFVQDHLDRLYQSAALMHMVVPQSKDEILQIVLELVEKNDMPYSGLKLIVSGGDSSDGYTLEQPRLTIIQQPLPVPSNHFSVSPFTLMSHPFQRQLPQVKTTDYLMAIYLQPQLKAFGGQDILYTHEGMIRECPRSNFFLISEQGHIVTAKDQVLKGITRKNILEEATANGITVEERPIALEEIKTAKGAFIASSTKRIIPVSKIDMTNIPTDSPILQKIFDLLVQKEHAYLKA